MVRKLFIMVTVVWNETSDQNLLLSLPNIKNKEDAFLFKSPHTKEWLKNMTHQVCLIFSWGLCSNLQTQADGRVLLLLVVDGHSSTVAACDHMRENSSAHDLSIACPCFTFDRFLSAALGAAVFCDAVLLFINVNVAMTSNQVHDSP